MYDETDFLWYVDAARDAQEGKTQPQGIKLSEIRPIEVESPQERGLGTDSGEKPKDEAANVPYKKKQKLYINKQ